MTGQCRCMVFRQAYPGYKIMIAPDVDISVTD